MVSISIPKKMNEEIDAFINTGYYDNRSELIRDALRLFFAKKAEIRLVAAIELYQKGEITISRAAEMAGVSFDNMKSILEDEGAIRRGRPYNKKKTQELDDLIS